MGCGLRTCRLINYGVTGAFMFSGLVFFFLGVGFVASFTGNGVSLSAAAARANDLTPIEGTPEPDPVLNVSTTPSPLLEFYSEVPVYLWFPIMWGCIVMVVALVGCCGIKMYSRLLLGVYVIMVIIIFFIQLIVGIVFTTMYQADLLLMKQEEDTKYRNDLEEGSSSIVQAFFVVLFLEVGVMVTAACFRNSLTGDEKEDKKVKKAKNLEDGVATREADREKRKNQFEMQSRRMAEKIKNKGKGLFS
mmetsp:Transcript_34705/g.68063  ORF Transcript_34705/g.68063 Transcript_34705/m.68063 type:complete len:247 (-) Transcript_34705:361-1101(-)